MQMPLTTRGEREVIDRKLRADVRAMKIISHVAAEEVHVGIDCENDAVAGQLCAARESTYAAKEVHDTGRWGKTHLAGNKAQER